MSTGFPKYSSAAKQGERGVRVFSRIISDKFGWLFKRNHQEHDFGIDRQIEFVTNEGAVTGKMIAAQIKFGESFFRQKNKWGYVYRGEKKHFNYLANYPIPVVICICDSNSEKCYWVHFNPGKTHVTDKGWSITIPFENVLSESKEALHALVPPVNDSLRELRSYWEFNNFVIESLFIVYFLDEGDVRSCDVLRPREMFNRLRVTKELAHDCQGKIEFILLGYDEDPRELFEISEVKAYIIFLDAALPDLFFFARSEQPTCTLQMFLLGCAAISCVDGGPSPEGTRQIEIDPTKVAGFLNRHWAGFNEMTDWLGMSDDENSRIGLGVLKCLGLPSASGSTEVGHR